MNFFETLKASANSQAQSFFFREMQKALRTDAKQLLNWHAFDGAVFGLGTNVEQVYLQPLEMPTFEILPYAKQLDMLYAAAEQIVHQYAGIYVLVGTDSESGGSYVYMVTEDVSLEDIERVFNTEDDDDTNNARRTASVPSLSVVQSKPVATAPVEPEAAPAAPQEPSSLTLVDGGGVANQPDEFEQEQPDEFEPEPELPDSREASDDVPAPTLSVDMLTIEQLETLDAIRRDPEAVAFIRNGLVKGVELFDSFVEFNDLAELDDETTEDIFSLYDSFGKQPDDEPADEPAPAVDAEEPDEFFAETEEPARVAPIGTQRVEDNTPPPAPVEPTHEERYAEIYKRIETQLPTDTASELGEGQMLIIMSRTVPNASGLGEVDVDYNLRLTIRREMFGGVKEIDKYRLYNGDVLMIECASEQVVIETILSL